MNFFKYAVGHLSKCGFLLFISAVFLKIMYSTYVVYRAEKTLSEIILAFYGQMLTVASKHFKLEIHLNNLIHFAKKDNL